MRLMLALCLVLGCTMCGRAAAGAARRRVETLEDLLRGVRRLKHNMTHMLETVERALRAADCPILDRVSDALEPGGGAAEAWRRVLRRERRRGGLCDALTREDEMLLSRLFQQLGESGREAQEILLSDAIEEIKRALERARPRAAEAERLYGTLGVLAGLLIALVVI